MSRREFNLADGLRDMAAAEDGTTIEMIVERTPEAVARDGVQKTISEEAFNALMDGCRAWLASRLKRRFLTRRRGAQKVEMTLTVKLDGEEVNVLEIPLRVIIPDGGTRSTALG